MNNSPTGMLSIVVVIICAIRFLFDGVSISLFGHTLSMSHVDPSAYAAFLAPVLGAHSYVKVRMPKQKADNPDA